MKCDRDYRATSAVRRASSPLATAVGSSATEAQQDVSSSTDGAQRAVAEAQQNVSSSTDGAQRAVSPSTASAQRAVSSSSRPAHSLSAPAGTRERGQGGFTLGKNITGWQDGPMSRFLKPMSAAASVLGR